MAPSRKDKDIEIRKLELATRERLIDRCSTVFLTLIRWGGSVWIMYYVFRTVESLAGKTTDAAFDGHFDLRMLANRYMSQIIYSALGALGLLYGKKQNSLYKSTAKKLRRMEALERKVDPQRTGSGLEDGSKPNEEDVE